MATQKQILASRRNGALSRGPRTAAGKAKSKRNALRHGLAARSERDPALAEQTECLARAIAGAAVADQLAWAKVIARSQIDIIRVRAVRQKLAEQLLAAKDDPDITSRTLSELEKVDRYERRAISRRSRALRALGKDT